MELIKKKRKASVLENTLVMFVNLILVCAFLVIVFGAFSGVSDKWGMSYQLTGNDDAPVLPNIIIKCTHCKRALCLKKYTEKQLLEHAVGDRYYI